MTGALVFLHGYGARVLILFAVFLAVWGTVDYFRNHRLSGGFRSSYVLMAIVTPIQGLLGLTLLFLGHRAPEWPHYVYGAFATLFLPGAYLYSRGGSDRRETLILAGASWIVAIAYFRGISTG